VAYSDAMDERLDPPTLHMPGSDTFAAFGFAAAPMALSVGAAVGGPVGALLVGLAGVSAATGVGTLVYPFQRHRVRDARRRWRVLRAAARTERPVPLAKAKPGEIAVRGRVHVLDGVRYRGKTWAAWVHRDRVTRRCTCDPRCKATFKPLRTRWATGRFAIVDDTGLAVIDAIPLDLWRHDRGAQAEGLIGIEHGDEVRVLGAAEAIEAPDVLALSPAPVGYREAPRVLGFTPAKRHRVCVLV